MGRQPLGRGRPHRPRPRCTREAERCSAGSASHIDPDRPAAGLSIADQQIIEIAKAISLDARLLIMDEPTAALSGVEVRATVRRRPRPARRGPRPRLHLAPLRRGLRALRHRHRDARRRVRLDTHAIADTTVDGHRRRDGRPRGRRPVPEDRGAELGDVVLEVEGLTSTGRLPRRDLRGACRRDRRPGGPRRGRAQRDRPGRLRRRPVRRRPVTLVGKRVPRRRPASRDRAGPRPGARGPAPAGPGASTRPWPATSPASSARGLGRFGLLTPAPRTRPRRPWAAPARGEGERPGHGCDHA